MVTHLIRAHHAEDKDRERRSDGDLLLAEKHRGGVTDLHAWLTDWP